MEKNISNQYRTLSGENISLLISEKSAGSVVIDIINLDYKDVLKRKAKMLVGLGIFSALYLIISKRYLSIDIAILAALLGLIYQTLNLTKQEHITFIKEFALQKSTEFFLGQKTRLLIPTSKIYDIVINEVICDLSIKYILIVRTKGDVFQVKPIIPLLTDLHPRIDCLEIIYKQLRRRLA